MLQGRRRSPLDSARSTLTTATTASAATTPVWPVDNVRSPDGEFDAILAAAGVQGQVVIGVLEAAFEMGHSGLEGKWWVNAKEIPGNGKDDDENGLVDDVHGWNFVENNLIFRSTFNGQPSEPRVAKADVDHGAHVAGIASRGTNRVKVMALLGRPSVGGYDLKKTVAAIDYAVTNGARVINMSFSTKFPGEVDALLQEMRRYPNVAFVLSAGNDGRQVGGKFVSGALGIGEAEKRRYLAANKLPNLLVVAAMDGSGKPAAYTNWGNGAVLAARGDVSSTVGNGEYRVESGTSMAAPNVAALVGRCLILDPKLDGARVKCLLVETSDQRQEWQGMVEAGGPVNNVRAMRMAALSGLVRSGQTPRAAASKLSLEEPELSRLLALLPKLAP